VCWSIALSNNINVAKAYPIVVGLTLLLVSFANMLLFQDKITYINILGIFVVIFGIFLLLK
jgi:multidrug transporter EmrE-like cation transporter